jgi:hypothetical protein
LRFIHFAYDLRRFAFIVALAVLVAPAGLCAAPGQAGKIVILLDESASMNKQNAVNAAKLWVAAFFNTFTRPYQIILAGFSETAEIHAEASTADPAQVSAMLKKAERLQARGIVTDFEKPFAYLASNKDSIALAILITGGGPEIWDDKNWYLSRTIRHDDRYASLNADYRRIRDGGGSRKERYRKLAKSYEKRNQELIGQWLSAIRDSPTIQLIALDISGSNAHIRSWADKSGGELVVADMKGRDPQAALRSAFDTLQEKAGVSLDEPLPQATAQRIQAGAPPLPAPVPTPAPVVTQAPAPAKKGASTRASTPGQNGPRWDLLAAIVAGLLVCVVFFIWPKREPAREDAPEEIPPNEPAVTGKADDKPQAPHRDTGPEIEKTEEASAVADPQELMAHLWHGTFDRRSSIRIPARPGTMDVVWLGADGGEHRGEVSGVSWGAVLFDAKNHRDETIVAILYHPGGHRFRIQSYRTVERGPGQKALVIEKFADTITDRMNWIELLTRLDNDQ